MIYLIEVINLGKSQLSSLSRRSIRFARFAFDNDFSYTPKKPLENITFEEYLNLIEGVNHEQSKFRYETKRF